MRKPATSCSEHGQLSCNGSSLRYLCPQSDITSRNGKKHDECCDCFNKCDPNREDDSVPIVYACGETFSTIPEKEFAKQVRRVGSLTQCHCCWLAAAHRPAPAAMLFRLLWQL